MTSLSRMEQRLLNILQQNIDQIVPYENLIAALWNGVGDMRNIRELIKRLRDKRPNLSIFMIYSTGIMLSSSRNHTPLTRMEMKLLHALEENKGKVVTYKKLDKIIWDSDCADYGRRFLLHRLRTKRPRLKIKTVQKKGLILLE